MDDQDSIRTYANLSSFFGNPVSMKVITGLFRRIELYARQRRKTGIVIHVLNKDPQTENAPLIPTHIIEGNTITNNCTHFHFFLSS